MRALSLLILLVAAVPVLAQPPDTLRLAPCEIAALGDAGPELLRGRWLRLDIDPLTMLSLIDSTAIDELDEVAKNVAPFPLDDFIPLVLSGLDSGKSGRDIARDIGKRHELDDEYDIDPEQLSRGMTILKSAAFVKVFLVERSEKTSDDIVVITRHVRSREEVGRDLSIVEDPLLARTLRGMKGGRRETAIVESGRSAVWSGAADSIAVRLLIDASAIDTPHIFAVPPLNDIDDGFFRMEKASADALINAVLSPWTNDYPLQWMFFHILNVMDENPSYSHEEFMRQVTTHLCSIPHHRCASHYDFTDSATWRRIGTMFRETLHRYLTLPHRFYAVVAADTVSAFIAFPIDTTHTIPIMLTREEMDATPAMYRTDWHDRLMRSIRDEECWAERMEGF